MNKILVYIALFFLFFNAPLFAQKGGLPLAEEYYGAGEYLKAISIYENFTADPLSLKKVYEKYLDCFLKLKKYDQAEKLIRKMQKTEPQNAVYKIDLALFYQSVNKPNETKKIIEKMVKECGQTPENIETYTELLQKNNFYDASKLIYLNARKTAKNDFLFALDLAQVYKIEKNTDQMMVELIRVLLLNQNDKELLKAKLQDYITTDVEFKKLEELIFEKIRENPEQLMYNDLLIWIYIQKRNFYKAFVQAKAYDKLMKLQGNKLMEIGKIAMENKDYDQSIEIFEYVTIQYKNTGNYPLARKYKIQAKEELVKQSFPIDPTKIRSLIVDYKNLVSELGRNQQTTEALRSMAILYGFYLDRKDSAQVLLEEVLKYPWLDPIFSAKCKLDLGDIYLLKNEPWEATLLYSQVEKAQKEALMGHEAKLRNAKLSYFTGQFQFAQEHLDVLKLATTREIANDAMDLSLFIIDNTGMDDDTTYEALQTYANIELVIFQNKYELAQKKLDSMLVKYKGHSLNDEIYFLQAKIDLKMGKFQSAIGRLETLGNLFKSDIYGDDAAYLLAKIYEENLHDKAKAMDLYNKFLIDFPSSIYGAEARKRYRILRGDLL